ncbi:MAG: aspartyl protease family protein [Brevundimonas sp.]|uniref:aspartyl protease family protein n=1 Tax=Brevundimonas sp. TaxID=1871086 RepID=UPI0025C5D1B5|nr:aspartyl protease family protein [Brevundimonas sp.]MBX3477905.1 aspartyl protease family protein [Brevundimonas sp.]
MDRRLFLRLGLGAAVVGGAVWLRDHVLWAPPRAAFPADGGTGWTPWAVRAVVPTVRARIGGREVRALVDSGAQYSVIDRPLFEALPRTETGGRGFDLPLMAHGVGGPPQMGRGAVLDVSVGGLRLSGLRAAILDLGPLAGDDGLGTPLILGQDVLSRVILDLDVERRRLAFADPATHEPPASVHPVEVGRKGRALATTVTIEGRTVRAVVDTGASGLLALRRSAAEAAGLLDGRPVTAGTSMVLGGVVAAQVVEARSVAFADQTYHRRPVSIFADTAAPGVPEALLGMDAFAGRRVVMDLGAGRLWASRLLDLTVG